MHVCYTCSHNKIVANHLLIGITKMAIDNLCSKISVVRFKISSIITMINQSETCYFGSKCEVVLGGEKIEKVERVEVFGHSILQTWRDGRRNKRGGCER